MIYLGTSGYSYKDWKDVYYPAGLARQKQLAFYAQEFNAVELNFTYYRMPTSEQLQKMAAQTPADFRFSVKAHQDITHKRTQDLATFAQFREALQPLQQNDKLGAVLLQFPYSFRNTKENETYIQHCIEQLPGLPLIVEFRRGDWVTQHTLAFLREKGAGFCNVDMPGLPGLLPKTTFVTAPTAYTRFHGRNAQKWWQHKEAWERYDYSYSTAELEEWIPHIRKMNEQAENCMVFANNHWQGQAVTTIKEIQKLLEQGEI